VIPLFIEEPFTPSAQAVLETVDKLFAWSWMRVEVEAGFVRRKAGQEIWREWRKWSQGVYWLHVEAKELDHLCSFNRPLGLRAADAGHLYVCEKMVRVVPDLLLVTFDDEMKRAAKLLGMDIW
jgi:predicted nucleic acid-binding protein